MQSILMISLRQILTRLSLVIFVTLPLSFMMSGCAYKAPGKTTLNEVREAMGVSSDEARFPEDY